MAQKMCQKVVQKLTKKSAKKSPKKSAKKCPKNVTESGRCATINSHSIKDETDFPAADCRLVQGGKRPMMGNIEYEWDVRCTDREDEEQLYVVQATRESEGSFGIFI